MIFWMKQVVFEYFKQKWVLFLFITVFLAVGTFFGAAAAKTISLDQSNQLSVYFNTFLENVPTTPLSEQTYFKENILSNLYILLAIYFLGLTVIGIPLVLVAVFSRGFILGFTVGFLVREKSIKGLLFALVSVLPHNLLVIPAIIAGAVIALSFSTLLIRRRFITQKVGLLNQLGIYSAVMLLLSVVLGAAAVMETFVTPVFIKTAAAYII